MARISTKYKCGQQVFIGDISGKITAITIRGRGRSYEFSYINSDGNPASVASEECELTTKPPNIIGFGQKSRD